MTKLNKCDNILLEFNLRNMSENFELRERKYEDNGVDMSALVPGNFARKDPYFKPKFELKDRVNNKLTIKNMSEQEQRASSNEGNPNSLEIRENTIFGNEEDRESRRKGLLKDVETTLDEADAKELPRRIKEFLTNFYQLAEVKDFDFFLREAQKYPNNSELLVNASKVAEKIFEMIDSLEIRAKELNVLDDQLKNGLELARKNIAERLIL